MRSFSILAAAAAMALVGVCASAQAAVVTNVRFGGSGSPPGEPDGEPGATVYTGAAVVGSSGDQWNLFTSDGTAQPLKDTAGIATSLSLTWTADGYPYASAGAFNGFSSPSVTPPAELMRGYVYASGTKSLIVSGLSASTQYDLYVYSEGDSGCDGRRLGVNANGVIANTTAAVASAGTFIEGQNYLLMHVAADNAGVLDIAYSTVVGEANINGFQLVSVPEPMSLGLVGLGAVVLLRRRRAAQA